VVAKKSHIELLIIDYLQVQICALNISHTVGQKCSQRVFEVLLSQVNVCKDNGRPHPPNRGTKQIFSGGQEVKTDFSVADGLWE
jgi:hypothetical protein